MQDTYCAYCGGEIYRYDPVHMTIWGILHEDCLPEILKGEMTLQPKLPQGAVCACCRELLEDSQDTVELDGEYLHEDCFFDYISERRFPIDY